MPVSCAPRPAEKRLCQCGCGRMFRPTTKGNKYALMGCVDRVTKIKNKRNRDRFEARKRKAA